jgi:hypothetical protein
MSAALKDFKQFDHRSEKHCVLHMNMNVHAAVEVHNNTLQHCGNQHKRVGCIRCMFVEISNFVLFASRLSYPFIYCLHIQHVILALHSARLML